MFAHRPKRSAVRISVTYCLRFRCQAAVATITAAANISAAKMVCGNWVSATGFVSTAPMSVSSARPRSSLISKPTGFCMKAFAARMKYAEMIEAIEVNQIVARWAAFGSLSQPKIHSPIKVASRKKAIRPSMASGAPKMSPTKRE